MSNIPKDVEKEMQEKIQYLVTVAFSFGILKAIEEARKMNNPYILDLFHDTLVDTLYNELIERKMLDELK